MSSALLWGRVVSFAPLCWLWSGLGSSTLLWWLWSGIEMSALLCAGVELSTLL